jgi:hypothetical protein
MHKSVKEEHNRQAVLRHLVLVPLAGLVHIILAAHIKTVTAMVAVAVVDTMAEVPVAIVVTCLVVEEDLASFIHLSSED